MFDRSCLGALGAAGLFFAASGTSAAPIDAIRAADMDAMIPEIIAVYEDAGLSWDRAIDWHIGPFTTTYWFFDPNEREVTTGAVPGPDEIADYWQEWSKVLTDGNFDPAGFFASDTEAAELARFNQYVLATHESAHAITFRYDFDHLSRHDWDINCREYYADRITVAILNDQAAREPDMARWRGRYLDLVQAMGETIPDQYRYHIPDFAALDADCALIDVAQPTPDTMQPYASAYFERYRVLLEADLPPLGEIFETHLGGRLAARLERMPFDVERSRYQITTGRAMERVTLGGWANGTSGSHWAAFDPSGALWFAHLRHDQDASTIALNFGTHPEPGQVVAAAFEWPWPQTRALEVSGLAVLSPDEFVLALDHWEPMDDGTSLGVVTYMQAIRAQGSWTLEVIRRLDGVGQGTVLREPGGSVHFIMTGDQPSSEDSESWYDLEIDPVSGDVVREGPLASRFNSPLAVDSQDRIYEELTNLLWRSTPEGEDTVLFGRYLRGLRDGNGEVAEINSIEVMQWMEDGSAKLVELSADYTGWVIRELTPLE